MADQWQYQLRIDLADELAEVARRDPRDPALGRLPGILAKHGATVKSQFDAFAGYVAEAERHGTENYPLYDWTKATIENPAKKVSKVGAIVLRRPIKGAPGGLAAGPLEVPDLVFTVPTKESKPFYDWFEDFVVKGNSGPGDELIDVSTTPVAWSSSSAHANESRPPTSSNAS